MEKWKWKVSTKVFFLRTSEHKFEAFKKIIRYQNGKAIADSRNKVKIKGHRYGV